MSYKSSLRDRSTSHCYHGVRTPVPTISIITTVDCFSENFSEMARSLCSQSLQSIEWFVFIASDQGGLFKTAISSLDVSECLDIHLLSYVHEQTGSVWQETILKSSGQFICFLDADTVFDPTYIEKCIWFLDANPAAFFCNTYTDAAQYQDATYSIDLGQGTSFIEQSIKGGQNITLRAGEAKSIAMRCLRPAQGAEFVEFVLSIVSDGHWGITLPETLCRLQAQSSLRLDVEAVRILVREKYASIHECSPHVSRAEYQPYGALKKGFSVDNFLTSRSDKLRIMLLLPWMVTGGADKFNLDLVEMLVGKGHKVTICATLPGEHPWQDRFENLTPDVFVLRRFLEVYDFPRFLVYLIKSRRIDTVIISGSSIGYQLLPYLRSHTSDTSFLDLCHVEEPNWNSGGHPRCAVGYQDMLDLNLVSTRHLSNWMVEKGADESRIRVLYTGVEEYSASVIQQKRQQIRDEFGIPDDYPVIIFAGRICEQKRPDVLARVLKGIHDKGIFFHAFIVGDGDLRPLFESLLDDYGLKSFVLMCGSVPHERWLDLLQASDLFLLPSDYEGISIALLEAMSVGVVPVVSDVGGQKEIVRSGAGYLIAHGDGECDSYVDALSHVLVDASLRRQMGENARTLIERYFSKQATLTSFEHIVIESRQLMHSSPRVLIPKGFATELATAAVELDRLNDAVHWLWGREDGAKGNISGLMNWLLAVRQSKIGVILLKSTLFRRALAYFFGPSK